MNVAARLETAHARWSTVRGVVRQWRSRELVSVGFERHFAALASAGWQIGPTMSAESATPEPDLVEATLAVAAARDPDRRRVQAIARRGEEWLADLVVVAGDSWWARTGDGVLGNGGDPHHRHGGTEVLELLDPRRVPLGYALTPTADRPTVAGRPCTTVLASPLPPADGPRRPGSEVFAMIAGGDRFRLDVDDALGVLLRVAKEVDGRDAEVVGFTEVAFDVALDDDLFAPLS